MIDNEKGQPKSQDSDAMSDQDIDKVRELLFGREQRDTNQRLDTLEAKLAGNEKEAEKNLSALRHEFENSAETKRLDVENRLSEIGNSIMELGKAIQDIAKSR